MALDFSKPLRHTRTHQPVFINQHEGLFVVTYYDTERCDWVVVTRNEIPEWLENVPERRTLDCWLNVYREGVYLPYVCESKRTADKVAQSEPHKSRIACIHITQNYEVGEGLE